MHEDLLIRTKYLIFPKDYAFQFSPTLQYPNASAALIGTRFGFFIEKMMMNNTNNESSIRSRESSMSYLSEIFNSKWIKNLDKLTNEIKSLK